MYIHITGPDEGQVSRAKVLADDLLLVVRQEHGKVLAQVQQQQMELHQAQAQYAVYSAMGVSLRSPFHLMAFDLVVTFFRDTLHHLHLDPHHHLLLGEKVPRRRLHLVRLLRLTLLRPSMQELRSLQHQQIPKRMLPIGESLILFICLSLSHLQHSLTPSKRAAYGYDVNSAEFKEWQASQQQQYAQYYAAYAQAAAAGPAQPTEAPPPPPPPPS